MAARGSAGAARAASASEELRPVALATGMMSNPGYCPREAEGRRVIVQLRNGHVHGRTPVSDGGKLGWAADGRNGCRWSLHGRSAFDIVGYEVVR